MKPRILVWSVGDVWHGQALFGAIPGSLNGDEPHFETSTREDLLSELRTYYGEFEVREQPQ